MNFKKFSRTRFWQNTSGQLLLFLAKIPQCSEHHEEIIPYKKHEKSIFEIENYATFEIGRILSEVFDGKKINERILGNMLWEYNHKVMD